MQQGTGMERQLIGPSRDGLLRLKMTYEEYLTRFEENALVEWVDGEAILHPSQTELQAQVVGLTLGLVSFFVHLHDLGMVLVAPFELRLPTGSSREPDVLFMATEHFHRRTVDRWLGPADLVVEVQTAVTAFYDLHEKRRDYERSGVPEYWAIDPHPGFNSLRLFVLSASGRYEEAAPDQHGRFHSPVLPGFWLDPCWFWHDPLPGTIDLIAEIAPEAVRRKALSAYERRGSGQT
jgi:Uma2 family endonuclease